MEYQNYFKALFNKKMNDNISYCILSAGCTQWYSLRLNMVNIFFVQLPCYAYLLYMYFANNDIDITSLAMTVIYASEISNDATWVLNNFSQVETSMIYVERCASFEEIEPEEYYSNFLIEEKIMVNLSTDLKKLNASEYAPDNILTGHKIIKNGGIEFVNLSAKYPNNKENVLKNLTLSIKSGEKIGIIGRTGAGKTSLIKLFWRCLEPCEGKLIIDGKNIAKSDLKTLRSEIEI